MQRVIKKAVAIALSVALVWSAASIASAHSRPQM
jgi:hypothetical protein